MWTLVSSYNKHEATINVQCLSKPRHVLLRNQFPTFNTAPRMVCCGRCHYEQALLQMIRRSNMLAGLKAAERIPLAVSNSDSANALRDRRLDHKLTQIRRVCIHTCTRRSRQERRSIQASAVSSPKTEHRHSPEFVIGIAWVPIAGHRP